MDPSRRDEYKQRLFELTPADGKSIGNATLRELLKAAFPEETFTQEDYFDLRNSLRTDGRVERGKGKGGSVHRLLSVLTVDGGRTVAPVVPALDQVEPAEAPPEPREADLYQPFKIAIETGYVPDNDLKPWICEITAAQGRKNTGGRWTRPDVA